MDPRIDEYARLLVRTCLDVKPGWQVLIMGQPGGRPLIEAVEREIARCGAYALLRLSFSLTGGAWLEEAPEELLGSVAALQARELQEADSLVAINAPENTREGSNIDPSRLNQRQQAVRPHVEAFFADTKPWVGCQFPTTALAQDAGMTLAEFEEFLYGAVLIDWTAAGGVMRGIADRFDAAGDVRVVADGTDLCFSLEGRNAKVDAAGANMPGGEIFYSPVENSAEGVVEFSEYPACYLGHQVPGVRLRFEGGRVVDASAGADQEFLLATLDTDDGARVLGEFGIGCNPGIQRHMRNTLFDEKIEGTVHFALGNGFPFIGGQNTSAVHWDMVKDLRRGGRIELDGKVVQEHGVWKP